MALVEESRRSAKNGWLIVEVSCFINLFRTAQQYNDIDYCGRGPSLPRVVRTQPDTTFLIFADFLYYFATCTISLPFKIYLWTKLMGRIHATIQQGNSTPAKTRENFDELTSYYCLNWLTNEFGSAQEFPTFFIALQIATQSKIDYL